MVSDTLLQSINNVDLGPNRSLPPGLARVALGAVLLAGLNPGAPRSICRQQDTSTIPGERFSNEQPPRP